MCVRECVSACVCECLSGIRTKVEFSTERSFRQFSPTPRESILAEASAVGKLVRIFNLISFAILSEFKKFERYF